MPNAHPLAVRAALVVLSAALLWLALPPVGLAPLALVALAPFLVALQGLEPRPAFRTGLAFGYLSGAANAHWFVHVFPWYFAVVLWAIIAIFPAVYAGIHAAAAKRGPALLVLTAPAAWIALDWFRSEVWHLRFAWFTLGHALSGNDVLRQNADLAGVYGLTLVAFATSLALERAVAYRKDGRAFVLVLVVIAANLAFLARGNRVLGFAPRTGQPGVSTADIETRTLRVLAVQDEHPGGLEPKRSLTRKAAPAFSPDVILWPEDSFVQDYEKHGFAPALEGIASLASQAFVFGSMRAIAGEAERMHNAAVVLDPRGQKLGEYWKRVPVQFVEAGVVPGKDPFVVSLPGARVGVMICYDGTYPFVARDLVHAGAEAILVPTWDMSDWGAIQHAHHALFYGLRACELRRPIVRAASSGVTLAVDAWGRETARLPLFEPGTLACVVHPNDTETPYARGGYALPWLASVIALLGLGASVVARKSA